MSDAFHSRQMTPVVSGQLPLASTPDHYEFLVSSFRRPFTDRERKREGKEDEMER